MYGVPVFPIKPEHGQFVFFVDPSSPDVPVIWGKVKCRKLDKWLMYDPSTGGTHVFDQRTGLLKVRYGTDLQLAWVGNPDHFMGLSRDVQRASAFQHITDALARQKSVGQMAPTYPRITSYTAPNANPYRPRRGDLACFVDTRAPQVLSQVIRVTGRRGHRWYGHQINGTSTLSFDPSTGSSKPFGYPMLLAWVADEKELINLEYNDVFDRIKPLVADAYSKLIQQSLITNPL